MRICIFQILFFIVLKTSAQTHRIDSTRQALATLKGIAEVNALNALSNEFYFYWIHADSSLKYASLAFEKASAIHFNSGRAVALLNKAGVEGRLLGHPKRMETYTAQAFNIVKDGKDFKTISFAHYSLGTASAILGKYKAALEHASKAKQFAIETKDEKLIGWAEEGIGFVYFKSGEYWKAFPHLYRAQKSGKKINDSLLTTLSLALIARSFNMAGDPAKSIDYYKQCFQYAVPFIYLWSHIGDMADAYLQLSKYDSALYYQQLNKQMLEGAAHDPKVFSNFSSAWGYTSGWIIASKQYDTVLQQLLPVVNLLRNTRDVIPFMQALFTLGKVYEAKKNYQRSLVYARELCQVAKQISNKQWLKAGNELLSSVFSNIKNTDSAFYYYRQYVALKDSMETVQFAGRTALYIAASEAENRISLLEKDKEINEQQLFIHKKELQKQSQLKNGFIGGSVLLVILSLLIFRNIILKKKNEKLQNEQVQSGLKRKALELEMQALRAQMNPHFIFNCLSAIDNLIQTNQSEKATFCLSKFAKLIRGVLDSSKNNLVPFYKDFDTLKLYLELEQFRCGNKFSYEIKAEPGLVEGGYKVPPLLIQPFIENAIHHGLLNKEEDDRSLYIEASVVGDHIVYSITDNGVGRQKAGILKEMNRPGQKAYGIDITKERIFLHNKNGIDKDLFITDLEEGGVSTGTRAVIRINCEC
jgi:tetratricopeptide (TPR) repeat protein